MRADQLVLQRGLAPTRSAAARLIEHGAVRWRAGGKWAKPRKAGEDLPDDCELEVTDDAELRYASRGGLKLEGALAHCKIDVTGLACLDIGQGTGGFTDALLQRGAASVVGIEVGHGQLHPKLQADARVRCFEGVNGRDTAGSAFEAECGTHGFDLVVGDVSFITLTHILPTVVRQLKPGGTALLLVKPQFELQPGQVGKGGIVRDEALYAVVEQRIRDCCATVGLSVLAWLDSSIQGGDGNREFFIHARRAA